MNKGKLAIRMLGGAAVVVALAWFAYANTGQYVDVHFGLFSLRDVSVPAVMYGSVIVGMLLVLGISWRSDLRTRRALERYDQIAANVLDDFESQEERVNEQVSEKS
jgi:uncharacterized integral membrane protein